MAPRLITVLGGGITGLSSAFHLSRKFPGARIFLLEKQKRLGGWIQSERLQLPNISASVLLEGGPRTLQPNGRSVLELVNFLRLEDKIVKVPKTAPAAKVRYLYIPQSYGGNATGLQKLPSSIASTFFSPLLFDILSGVVRDAFRAANRPKNISDESLNSFLTRRFGDTFASKFGSALVHGIYAADSCQLSVKAAFPSLWYAEERGRGSVMRGLWTHSRNKENEPYELGDTDLMHDVSVYSFKDGMKTLTNALESYLQLLPNVLIIRGTQVQGIESLKNSTIKIWHSISREPIIATHAVSALPLPILSDLLARGAPFESKNWLIPHLRHNSLSTVHVLNLVFPCPPAAIHPEGFGYLVSRPRTGYPSTSSTPGILGVVFDSCTLHEQDSPLNGDYYQNASHTKLTVVMGGPYPQLARSADPAVADGNSLSPSVCSVLDALKVQLTRDLPDPISWRMWNNEACIPTLFPGHLERMREVQAILKASPEWSGRLVVIGAGVGGVSVADCVEAARHVGRDWM